MAVLAVVFTIYDYGIATSRVKDSPVRGEQGRRDDRPAVVAASNSAETRQAPSDTRIHANGVQQSKVIEIFEGTLVVVLCVTSTLVGTFSLTSVTEISLRCLRLPWT